MDSMLQAGYEHYEISNFAKPGSKSKHNSSYWQGKKYYGFGPSAHSFDEKRRWWNISNNALYIQSLKNNTIPFEEEILTQMQQLNEYIMTSLRTSEGLSLTTVKNRFGKKISNDLQSGSKKWEAGGKLLLIEERIVLTKEGKLFADGIAADLFF
jgi:oxygen-independent coproporphyrinogen-3 oxidase